MKISRILSASVLAGAVLFAGTACSAPSNDKPADAPSSSAAKPEDSKAVVVTKPMDEAQKATEGAAVAAVVTGYYNYVSDPSNSDAIRKASESLKSNGNDSSPAALKKVTDSLPDGFKYFDVSSPDLVKASYTQLRKDSTLLGRRKIEIKVPATSVQFINDNKATVEPLAADGSAPSLPGSQALHMTKNETGSWVITLGR